MNNVKIWGVLMVILVAAACVPTPASSTPAPAATPAPSTSTPVQVAATLAESPTPDLPATLAVPTMVPVVVEESPTSAPTVSALRRIMDEGVVRVGVLYNTPPLSSLNERGRVVGYEADLARAMAEDWEVEIEFVQVTRSNAVIRLFSGDVDLLLASTVHRRESEAQLGFSHTYFRSGEMFLVRDSSPVGGVADLAGMRIGVVQGTDGEHALARAMSAGRLNVAPSLYVTLDSAVGALGNSEIDAVLADRVELVAVRERVGEVRILDEMLEQEPYAVAFRRGDTALEYMVNRSLQRIYTSDKLAEFRRTWFPNINFQLEIPVWAGLEDDERVMADLDLSMQSASGSLFDAVTSGGPLRVAGLDLSTQLAPYNQRIVSYYRGLVEEMASRWGAAVEFLPDSVANARDLVASGQAHLAVNQSADWTGPFEIVYSTPLLVTGDRLMVPANSRVESFADLRGGRWVGVFASEPGKADVVNELADSVNAAVNIFTIINDNDAVYSMVVEQNIDAVFGDYLRVQPLVDENADLVRLLDKWYSRESSALALPRSDTDGRALVEVTLQDMAQDGALARIWQSTIQMGDPPVPELWPGAQGMFLGVSTRTG